MKETTVYIHICTRLTLIKRSIRQKMILHYLLRKVIVANAWYNNFVMLCIIIAGAIVGVQTYPEFENAYWPEELTIAVQSVFTTDILLKILQEGSRPQNYW